LASGGSATRSGTEINRGRRDDVTKHARFVVGTQFNIAQFSAHYPTILADLAACDLSSSSAVARSRIVAEQCSAAYMSSHCPPPFSDRGEAPQDAAEMFVDACSHGGTEADDGSGGGRHLASDVGVPLHRLRQSAKPATDFIRPLAYFFLISGVQRS